MKQFAIIGLSTFGIRILEELTSIECEVLIVDKKPEVIELYKDKVTSAYIADAINQEMVSRIIPPDIDAVVVDLGDKIEVSILVTNYLKKMGIKKIIVKAETDQHGEILDIVGATHVIFPNMEAAKKITPILLSSLLFNYMPISNGLVMAEVKIPEEYVGKTLIEARIRETKNVNIVAIRQGLNEEYDFFKPEYRMEPEDIFLVVGNEKNIIQFSGTDLSMERRKGLQGLFKTLFSRK